MNKKLTTLRFIPAVAIAITLLFTGESAWGAKLTLSLQSNGLQTVTVAPSAVVTYRVLGQLDSSTDNQGLAGFAFDLEFTGGPLTPANTPTTEPLNHFVSPMGFTNPAGYGGTVINGLLVQVGGLQNTFANTSLIAPTPIGTVAFGVAHTSIALANGTLTAPSIEGTYILSLSNVEAAIIKAGQPTTPPLYVDRVDDGIANQLQIIVSASAIAGACCLPNAQCSFAGPADCTTLSGLYQGNSSACADVVCAAQTPALSFRFMAALTFALLLLGSLVVRSRSRATIT